TDLAIGLAFSSFDQHGAPSSARIPIDAIEGFDVIGFLVASPALLLIVLAVGASLAHKRRHHGGHARPGTAHAQELATADPRLLVSLHGRVLLEGSHALIRRSRRQRESLSFNGDEQASERADPTIEIGRLGALQIREEPADPGREMPLEQLAIRTGGGRKISADEPPPALAPDPGAVLPLVVAVDALEAEPRKVLAQARERPFLQETREIVRAVRQQLAAADADEEIEELALGPFDAGGRGRLGERRVRKAERARVRTYGGNTGPPAGGPCVGQRDPR